LLGLVSGADGGEDGAKNGATWREPRGIDDCAHGGLAFPDVIPDLAAAFTLDPALKVLSVGGEHDLITPFHQAELDLARLPPGSPVTFSVHAGGHMTYLDDRVRPLLRADLLAFYAAAGSAR